MANGVLRVGGAYPLPQVLRDLGANPREIFAAAGVDLAVFDNPENLIPFRALGRLIEVAGKRTGCGHIGLLVGQRNSLASLGLLGYVVKNSPDVETALRTLVLSLHTHDRGAVPTLSVEHGVVSLGYAILMPELPGMSQIAEGSLATVLNIMRELCGPAWRPAEVRFSHSPPRDLGPLKRYFQVPLRFDAEETATVFAERWLKQPVPNADPVLLRILQSQLDALGGGTPHALPDMLRGILRTMLLSGKSSADHVALLLGMHRRTLNRRLQDQGVAFDELRDEVRFEIARQMLTQSRAPLNHIATMLNYGDASAFSRAFNRWAGMTPTAWRERAVVGKRGRPPPKSSRARGKRA